MMVNSSIPEVLKCMCGGGTFLLILGWLLVYAMSENTSKEQQRRDTAYGMLQLSVALGVLGWLITLGVLGAAYADLGISYWVGIIMAISMIPMTFVSMRAAHFTVDRGSLVNAANVPYAIDAADIQARARLAGVSFWAWLAWIVVWALYFAYFVL